MADGRMLRKVIRNSKKLSESSDRAKVVYFMMLPHTDVKGRIEACPEIVRGQYLTMLKYSNNSIQKAMEELHRVGLITLYSQNGDQYAEYVRFEDFQTLNPDREAKSTIPAPTPADSCELLRTPANSPLSLSLSKDKIKLKEYMLIFDEARKLYPGTKGGLDTEFANFTYHCEHPLKKLPKIDWRKILPLLKPAIENQIEWRKHPRGDFRPAWKNFQRWINKRCWGDIMAVNQKKTTAEVVAELKRDGRL